MHYEVYFSKISSEWCGTRPFLSAWIDVAATLLLFLLCTAGRRKSAFVLTYSTLMVFGLSGNLVGISINLCKSIQKELFINNTP